MFFASGILLCVCTTFGTKSRKLGECDGDSWTCPGSKGKKGICEDRKYVCVQAGVTAVPTHIPKTVETLGMAENPITVLKPKDFEGMKSLERLLLFSNRIRQIPSGLFVDLAACTFLRLDKNAISNIAKDAFKGLKRLKKLILGCNELRVLKNGMFLHLWSLEFLALKDNFIETVEKGALTGMRTLQMLQLNGNLLKSIR